MQEGSFIWTHLEKQHRVVEKKIDWLWRWKSNKAFWLAENFKMFWLAEKLEKKKKKCVEDEDQSY